MSKMKKLYTTDKGATAIKLFIAELNGYKSGDIKDKEYFGHLCWLQDKLHNPDITTESGRKDFHEDIWLQRLYAELDSYYRVTKFHKQHILNGTASLPQPRTDHLCTTPIELDAGASMLQYIGLLMNDSRLMAKTNLIGTTLQDPWACDGIPRTQFKHAATPMLYASSKACHELWQDKGHKYTLQQVAIYNKELNDGALGLANSLKDFIINNVKPSETMIVTIWNDTFTIKCNRYKNVGDITSSYSIYDSTDKLINTIYHTHTHREPDLEQFRRYFQTLLVHCLDSQVANLVINKVMTTYGWGIDIHDAFIVHPEIAHQVRAWYCEALEDIHTNRQTILSNYFKSIGIGAESQSAWEELKSKVVPFEGTFKCNQLALK